MSSITIYDVAEAAGVSTATVSKVLSGQPYVSEKTKARVLSAVEQLNYVPNVAARGLAGARTNIIGAVISYDPSSLFADPHLLAILEGAHEVVTANDCALLLSAPNADSDRLSAFRRLLGQKYVDGALVDGSLGEVGFTLLHQRGYPVVAIGYSEIVSCVHTDDDAGACAMTQHLLELGHRRIGIISGPVSDRLAMQARLDGHRRALEQAAIPFDESLLVHGTWRRASGEAAVASLMTLQEAPTAIFAFNDRMATGAIHWLQQQGYRVPDDVSVAGFDDIPAAATFKPPLTTVRQLSLEQGRKAAELLFDIIAAEEPYQRREISLPTELVVRHSTGPREGG